MIYFYFYQEYREVFVLCSFYNYVLMTIGFVQRNRSNNLTCCLKFKYQMHLKLLNFPCFCDLIISFVCFEGGMGTGALDTGQYFLNGWLKAQYCKAYSEVKNPKVGSFGGVPEDFEGLRSQKKLIFQNPQMKVQTLKSNLLL